MEKISRPRVRRAPETVFETRELEEDYKTDYKDHAAGQRYFPIVAYIGVMLAILLGAVIIGLSILVAGGKGPAFLGGSANLSNAPSDATPAAGTAAVEDNAPVDFEILDNYPMLGNPDAPVTLVEFADFQCPFCKQFHEKILPQLKSKYIETGIAKMYFVHFPFLGGESTEAAIASECARQEGKFWDYHDLLYDNQEGENNNAFSDQTLKGLAKQAGLNAAKFAACQIDEKIAATVAEQFQAGQVSGVQATPTLLINGVKVEGVEPFPKYQALIEKAQNGN